MLFFLKINCLDVDASCKLVAVGTSQGIVQMCCLFNDYIFVW